MGETKEKLTAGDSSTVVSSYILIFLYLAKKKKNGS